MLSFSLVGDDGTVIHPAGAEHRDDGAEGDKLRWECVLVSLQFPNVLVQFGLRGDDLAAIRLRCRRPRRG